MKKYIAHLSQGQGCDYTIGCGQVVIDIEANSFEEAQQKLEQEICENYSHMETMLAYAKLYEVSNMLKINVPEIYDRLEADREKERKEEKEKKEREEFERLKAKFGS